LTSVEGAFIWARPERCFGRYAPMETVTRTRVELEHPYQTAGIIVVILSLVVFAFSLGVLNRCGNGTGVCFDVSGHAAGDAGLVLFIVLLIIGVALIAYTGSAQAFTTRTQSRPPTPAPAAPAVTNVFPQAAPAVQPTVTNVYPQAAPRPQPTVTNVYPQAAAAPATTVVVAPQN
jgi:hypothetical protein